MNIMGLPNITVVAKVFPTIALVLGFYRIVTGNSDGWFLVILGAIFQFLWLQGRRR